MQGWTVQLSFQLLPSQICGATPRGSRRKEIVNKQQNQHTGGRSATK